MSNATSNTRHPQSPLVPSSETRARYLALELSELTDNAAEIVGRVEAGTATAEDVEDLHTYLKGVRWFSEAIASLVV